MIRMNKYAFYDFEWNSGFGFEPLRHQGSKIHEVYFVLLRVFVT